MYTAVINGREYRVKADSTAILINDKEVNPDIISTGKNSFHVIHENRSFNMEVLGLNEEQKMMTIRVNNNTYQVELKDEYDALLHEMGMDASSSKKVNDIKAPMPGMVLKVMVENGQKIQKGEAIVVLEAMKMENILKAPSDGVVKKIHIIQGDKVEKNQVLINMG